MPMYGYARVSTRDQDLSSQEAELKSAGCAKVFKEKVSGAKSDRAELAKAIRKLDAGDVLVVTRLDRLARSTRDLLNVLAEVAKRGAGFKSLKDTWCDTTTMHGRLMLTVLAGLAEFERELIRARTGEGGGCALSWRGERSGGTSGGGTSDIGASFMLAKHMTRRVFLLVYVTALVSLLLVIYAHAQSP